MTAKHLVYFNQ